MFRVLSRRLEANHNSIGRLLVTAMVVGFASLIVAGFAAAWETSRNLDHTRSVNHTYQVELSIVRANLAAEQAEASRRGYLLTGNPLGLANYRKAADALPRLIEHIAALTRDNPRQQANIARLREFAAELNRQQDATISLAASGDLPGAMKSFRGESAAKRMTEVRALGARMGGEERGLLAARDAELRQSVAIFYTILATAGALLAFVAIVTLVTVLRYTRDLNKSRDVLRDFADSLEELVAERTGDLTRANEEIQRFAYIVSHDLRSPLVNVMGFTAELDAATAAITDLIDRAEESAPEIVTDEARNAAREDLPEAIGFIRTSTQKMDRLINAILKLSREGRRTITPERLNMDALVGNAQAAIQQLFDDRGAEFAIEGHLPELVSDRLAIEQILSNLIENAVKYLDPSRPGQIVVRGAREGPRVHYEVQDNGRGIAVADYQRVFDLFRRAGNQDQPGEGIGLAHVRALAYRLGGTIDVRSELGVGTTFRLTLPVTLTELEKRL
ncbi:MAG: CHASE3 domain-containing protein [Sphingomonas sp.]